MTHEHSDCDQQKNAKEDGKDRIENIPSLSIARNSHFPTQNSRADLQRKTWRDGCLIVPRSCSYINDLARHYQCG